MNIFLNKYLRTDEPTPPEKRVRVAIIDTGYSANDDLYLNNPHVADRVKLKCNFFAADDLKPNSEDWDDEHGHGTQVARLVLKFAPRADICVARISSSRSLNVKVTQLSKVSIFPASAHIAASRSC